LEKKLAGVFILSYLYSFLLGIFAYKSWSKIKPFFEGTFIFWLLSYYIYILIFEKYFGYDYGSHWIHSPFKIITNLFLAGLTLSGAFSNIKLSQNILQGNDLSYGIYIFHMLIINFFVQRGYISSWVYFIEVIALAFVAGYLSWNFIEKRALKLKGRESLIKIKS
jgi:peptidoglycan/LPS O-acetylase OafA/YrhL